MTESPANGTAVFDICDTLFDSNTTFDFLKFYLKDNQSFMRFTRIRKSMPIWILNAFCFKFFHQDLIRKKAVKYLRGHSKSQLKTAAAVFYDQYLVTKQRSEIIQLFQEFKSRGTRIFLVSATLDFLADIISEKIGADGAWGTELAYQDGQCTGLILKDLLGNKDRLLEGAGLTIKELTVVTDNITDYRLVKKAKHAYVVAKPNKVYFWKAFPKIEKMILVE